jgi:hypothetical protein
MMRLLCSNLQAWEVHRMCMLACTFRRRATFATWHAQIGIKLNLPAVIIIVS